MPTSILPAFWLFTRIVKGMLSVVPIKLVPSTVLELPMRDQASTEPAAPVGPAAPVNPVNPVAPTVPFVPAAPVAPVKPIEP